MSACLLALVLGCAAEDSRDPGFFSAQTSEDDSSTLSSGETGEEEESGEGDGDGEGDPDGSVCGDGVVGEFEACDDGVNDGSYGGCSLDCMALGPHCGDGVVGGPEQCDDANAGTADGCLGNCVIPRTCRDILLFDPNASSGAYLVAPKGPEFAFLTDCDMSTDGGGWTAIPLAELCSGNLDTSVTAIEAAGIEGIDAMCRPYTQDAEGAHGYHFDLIFPPGFEAFYLSDIVIKANAAVDNTSDIIPSNFIQTDWAQLYGDDLSQSGDVGFGSADDAGPVVSYAGVVGDNMSCESCELLFPGGSTTYPTGSGTTLFRIAWGEVGGQLEGWYPWWSGQVYLR